VILAPTTSSGGAGRTILGLPGDPDGLEASARGYEGASASMASAARQLRASVGVASAWEGCAALAHAERARALAAAHEVAAEAFSGTSRVLATYAVELRQAQVLAREADLASREASDLGVALAAAEEEAARASTTLVDPAAAARFGLAAAESAKMVAEAKVASLEAALAEATTRAGRLASEADACVGTATQQATTGLAALASLAGSGGELGLLEADAWSGYLGAPGDGAAVVLEAGENLGGLVARGDGSVLGDLVGDPFASRQARRAAAIYRAANTRDRAIAAADVALLRRRGVWRATPGFASDSPAVQAVIAARARAWLRAHAGASHEAVVLGLHLGGLALGLAAAGFSLAALLEGGEDPLADEAAAETDGAAVSSLLDAGVGPAEEEAAVEEVDGAGEAPAELAAQGSGAQAGGGTEAGGGGAEAGGGGASRHVLFDRLAVGSGVGEFGADAGAGAISGHMDWIGIGFDAAALFPGVGALLAGDRAIAASGAIAELSTNLRDVGAPEDLERLSSALAALESGRSTAELVGGLLDAEGLAASLAASTWAAANLGLSLAGPQP